MNRLLLALVMLLAGCNAQSVTATKVEPGAECPTGGIKLTGAGDDQLLCNGTNGTSGTSGTSGGEGATTLLSQSQLAPGDPRCANGGLEVVAGLDSGGDGGTPRDGVLQPGEVTSSTVVCAGSSSSRVGSLTPPAGAAGTSALRANGGQGTNQGGRGGNISLRAEGGTNGGHLKAWRTGQADATFTVPTPPAADLGASPLAITADTTLSIPANPTTVPAGTAFLTSQGLFLSKGATLPPARVTSLTVAAGATLSFPSPGFGATAVPGSCRIDGTLKLDRPTPQSPSNLTLECGDLVLSSGSKVLATGTATTRAGGSVGLSARGLTLALGTVDTSGFSSTAGSNQDCGSGGVISLSGSKVYVGGTLRANGGSGESAVATSGGTVDLSGGAVFNQATIESNGGAVVSNNDGDLTAGVGGAVFLRSFDTSGELRNRGTITATGGAVTGTLFTGSFGYGGRGGTIGLSVEYGPLTTDAAISALGGAGITRGGNGGSVRANLGGSVGPGAFGSLLVSGTIDVSGGQGPDSGGQGGTISFLLLPGAQVGAEIVLLGYQSLSANGALGRTGGRGGAVLFEQSARYYDDGESIVLPVGAGGGIVNATDVSAAGGDADTSAPGPVSAGGGEGGELGFFTQRDFAEPGATFEVLINTGVLSVNGGAGPNGGAGGSVDLGGTVSTTSSGAISAKGGAGSSLGGGDGGSISVRAASGKLLNTSACDASAGLAGNAPAGTPGVGGSITLVGAPTSNAATLTARGGSADLAAGTGGTGGTVRLDSLGGGVTENTVAAPAGIVVSGGAAFKPGASGTVLIDGFSVTDRWTR